MKKLAFAAVGLGCALVAAQAMALPNTGYTTPVAATYWVTQWNDGSNGGANGCGPATGTCSSHKASMGELNYRAIDIATPCGTAVYSSQAGTLTRAGTTSSGLSVRIAHSDNSTSVYAHLSNNWVYASGSWVGKNAIIGYSGSTGATACHLHWANYDTGYLGTNNAAYANDLRPIWGVPPNKVCGYGGWSNQCKIYPVCTPAQNGYAAEIKTVSHTGCASGYARYVCNGSGTGWSWLSCSIMQ
jgi:murein DD-endopeptidase MepM/ murein hydrolase activator NlpD